MTGTVLGFSLEPYGSSKLATYTIPTTNVRISLRKETAPLFLALLRDFHNEVEHLDPKSCWGHAPRNIAGTNTPSRHWPAIAVDANATQHPMGRKNTFTAGERKALDKVLARYTYQGKRIFRWGGVYSRPDDMHLEINVDRATALAAVKALQAPAKPQPTTPATRKPGSRQLAAGAEGADVGFVQRFLGTVWAGPVDNDYGPRTTAGVRRYQKMRGIPVTGVVDKKTWQNMGVKVTY